jgi:hypothetical protein
MDISEHVDLEQVFPEDQLYMSSVSPGALYTAIQNGDIVRRNDADDTDIAAGNAFDDAIWRWSPSRQQKEALVGQPLTPNSTNKYLTQGVFTIKVKAGGTPRYGNLVFLEGSNITLTDDGAGNFTFAAGGLTPYGSPITQAPDSGNVDGTQNSAARSDHKHNIPTAIAVSVTTANAQGASTTDFSRADHAHQGIHSLKAKATGTARYGDIIFLEGTNITLTDDGSGNFTIAAASVSYGSPVTQAPDTGNITGSGSAAYANHQHNIPTATAVSVTTANAQGASTTNFARADHAHQGIHSLKANAGGTARYGDLVFLGGTNITITDDGAGNYTFASTFSTTYGSPVTQAPDSGNIDGTASSAARSDHKHNIPTAIAVSVGTANAQGASTTDFSKADHVHRGISSLKAKATGTARYGDIVFLEGTNITLTDDGSGNFTIASTFATSYGSPVALSPDSGNIDGVATTSTRSDHKHNVPCDAPTTTLSPATSNAEGTGSSFTRNDHTHAVSTALVGVITTIQPDATASAGTQDSYTRGDHRHAIDAAAPVGIGSTNTEGTSTSFARADHIHSILGYVKAGVVASGSFSGNPKKATVSFTTAFGSTNYAISIVGIDARTWTYESKAVGGFVINANANAALSGEVSWTAILTGS